MQREREFPQGVEERRGRAGEWHGQLWVQDMATPASLPTSLPTARSRPCPAAYLCVTSVTFLNLTVSPFLHWYWEGLIILISNDRGEG